MKTLIMTTLLAVSISSNLMAALDKTCYPFGPNPDGFNRICVALENPQDKETEAEIEIYRYENLVKSISALRVYNPQMQVCSPTNPSFCYRRYEAIRIIPEDQNLPDIFFEIFMRVNKRSTCLSGNVSIKEEKRTIILNVDCPTTSWKNYNI